MGIMRKFKAVIFDLDDTLYPEIDYVISGFKVVSKFIACKINRNYDLILNELLDLFKLDRKNVFNRYLKQYNLDKEIIEECVNLYRYHNPNISLSDETSKLLCFLKENNFKLGIITDGRPEGQRNKIKALQIEEYFDNIIITDELGGIKYRKPCAIPYKKMLQELEVEAEEAVYIGDNPTKDFITANKLGIFTIMIKNDNGIYHNYNKLNLSKEYYAKILIDNITNIKDYI